MTTTMPRTRRSLKDSGPMVLVFPVCPPRAKERAKVKVRVRDAEAKVKEKVKVKVKVKAKVRVKVKENAKEKAKVKVRVSMSVQVHVQVMVVSSVGRRSTGPGNVPKLAGGLVALRRGGLSSAGTKRP